LVSDQDILMIVFENVSKTYHIRSFHKTVFTDVNFTIKRGESIGICGANGAGKSTLMRLIAGIEFPTTGKVTRSISTSWPIGYSSCFSGVLTGVDNIRFIARLYNRSDEHLIEFVEDFAQLGAYLYHPVSTYSAGMHARLAFGISLAIDFECYLIDEVTGAGDERFRIRCEEALLHRRDTASIIMTSHDPGILKRYCTRGAVVYGGSLVFFDTIDEANDVHHRLQLLAA
jgi:capsular polysaccharide transport system ATP-binding protein